MGATMKKFRAVFWHKYGGKAEVVEFDAQDGRVANAAVMNWLIDRPDFTLTTLTEVA